MIRVFLILLLAPGVVAADIYKCGVDGKVEFSDSPCGDSAERVEVRDNRIGGSLSEGLTGRSFAAEEGGADQAEDDEGGYDCPHISSTRLRQLKIREEVAPGMSPGDVLDTWGQPNQITTEHELVRWTFQDFYGERHIYFYDDCMVSRDSHIDLR